MNKELPEDIKKLLMEELNYVELGDGSLVKYDAVAHPHYFCVNSDTRFIELFNLFYNKGLEKANIRLTNHELLR